MQNNCKKNGLILSKSLQVLFHYFCIIHKLTVSLIHRISQFGIKRIGANIPNRRVKIHFFYLWKHSFNFPHHINTVSFSVIFWTDKYSSHVKFLPIRKKNRRAYNKSVKQQFVQMIGSCHLCVKLYRHIPGRSSFARCPYRCIAVK